MNVKHLRFITPDNERMGTLNGIGGSWQVTNWLKTSNKMDIEIQNLI